MKVASDDRPKPFTLDVQGAFLRRTNLSKASLRKANLSKADFSNAILREADFEDAILEGTIFKGADLSGAKNLTKDQLSKAILDHTTVLPEGISLSELVLQPSDAAG